METKHLALLLPIGVFILILATQKHEPSHPSTGKEGEVGKPTSGKTYAGQSNESYCLECIEGHTMLASTEMRHATDRYRTAGKMTPGVTEKVRVAIAEIAGIVEDARNTEGAAPEVKQGINEILDEVRWIRKEYGLSGRGLTTGHGTEKDLVELKSRVQAIQNKAYDLVSECPTCRVNLHE
ncbi:hypothetical protein CH330_01275 [candidate division WOR-3 bacterium JGI_Cruoil_03_51_56]|uniref:Uncharacterized protein n=1 Tax=candidate division WOR-3 bacterium JGI_Cruoil_03_51_56 TaxID=1973747 RepID=A0A235BYR9_UNCW3|nr:MAG: hypothetical protein CH330_01275 [candidate division WOR-3 bacterium JGI_Cruoil_03_51_56]